MSLFNKSRVGIVVKITGGILDGKYAMVAKEHPKTEKHQEGYSVVVEIADWPPEVPTSFNAIFVSVDRVLELTENEQAMLKIKFPNPSQFE